MLGLPYFGLLKEWKPRWQAWDAPKERLLRLDLRKQAL